MKKSISLDKNAEKELREFSEEVQLEFEAYFKILELEGKLDIAILHFFRKKTQKTPIKNLELAQRRFKLYEFH